jgi:hypothetical protein
VCTTASSAVAAVTSAAGGVIKTGTGAVTSVAPKLTQAPLPGLGG